MRVTLFLDHVCNLRCAYCYNGRKFERPMSSDVLERAVDMAFSDETAPMLSFFGGEPLLRAELMRVAVARARVRQEQTGRLPHFMLTTNGTLLQAHLPWLVSQGFELALSLDGVQAAHDTFRVTTEGQGTWSIVVQALRSIRASGLSAFSVIVVVDPATVRYLPDSFDLLRSLGVPLIHLNLNYAADWNELARESFIQALDALARRYLQACREGDAPEIPLLEDPIHMRVNATSCGDACDFGRSDVTVAPSGRLYPCDRLVGEDTASDVVIGDVWRGIDLERRNALLAAKNRTPTECAACALHTRCRHHCGCVNHALTGQVGEVPGIVCWFERQIVPVADRCGSTLFQEGNPVFLRRFYVRR